MFGLTGILIALVVLTIILAAVFLVRPSVTVGASGKTLAFIALCGLPALCIGTGMSFHLQRSKETAYCISCHSMVTHGESLYVLNKHYIPAQHFQNDLVPSNRACYSCHTNYTMYGPLKDKLRGLRYLYFEYLGTLPRTIHLIGTYRNAQCLHCHVGTRDFEDNLTHMPPLAALESNQVSCISSGCHDMIHNASEVGHLKMWTGGAVASDSSSTPPANAKSAAAAAPSKAPVGGSAGKTGASGGKAIFDSHGCSGCHGATGGGGAGPALTHISSQYPPAKLTALLKAPTVKMKAAGMAALTLNAADMKALVAYLGSLGGKSAASATTPSASAASSTPPAKAKSAAAAAPSKAPVGGSAGKTGASGGKAIFEVTLNAADMKALVACLGSLGGKSAASATTPSASAASSTPPAKAKSAAAAAPSKAPVGGSAGKTGASGGKAIFDSHGCSGCHGATGGGGAGPALTHISSQYPPAKLTALLKAPTVKMKAAGMAALTLNAADMKALVAYLGSLGGKSAASATTPSASAASSTPPAKAKSAAAAAPSKAPVGGSAGKTGASGGKAIFDSHGCSGCHGATGGGGAGPALTHISSQYPPAKLTALLKAPTVKMKAAGMAALTLNAADMKALVAYLGSLGGKSATSATTPSASAASSTPPAKAKSAAAAAPSKEGTAAEYHSFCASCHGDTGAGNGSAAVGFDPSPANFTDCAKMKSRSDEFLYEVVAKGGSAEGLSPTMPKWSIAFTDSQMHGLVEYVRSFCR